MVSLFLTGGPPTGQEEETTARRSLQGMGISDGLRRSRTLAAGQAGHGGRLMLRGGQVDQVRNRGALRCSDPAPEAQPPHLAWPHSGVL